MPTIRESFRDALKVCQTPGDGAHETRPGCDGGKAPYAERDASQFGTCYETS